MNTTPREFTMRASLDIQKEHLDRWKNVLNAEAYSDLVAYTVEANKTVTVPRYVARGTDLDNFIANWRR